jgi:hypothetical protein
MSPVAVNVHDSCAFITGTGNNGAGLVLTLRLVFTYGYAMVSRDEDAGLGPKITHAGVEQTIIMSKESILTSSRTLRSDDDEEPTRKQLYRIFSEHSCTVHSSSD